MAKGWANSLTEAGPLLSRSMTDRRVGSARAWKIESKLVVLLGIYLSISQATPSGSGRWEEKGGREGMSADRPVDIFAHRRYDIHQ